MGFDYTKGEAMKIELDLDYEDIDRLTNYGHVSTLADHSHDFDIIKDFEFTYPVDKKLLFNWTLDHNYLNALVVYQYYRQQEVPAAIFYDSDEHYSGYVIAAQDREKISELS
jgi:hypothetical protein